MSKKNMVNTAFLQSHTVTDPVSGLPVDLEIRRLDTGGIIGLDASFLEQLDGDPHCFEDSPPNPYDLEGKERLFIPDDEYPLTKKAAVERPHYILCREATGDHARLIFCSNQKLAREKVAVILAASLTDIFADHQDGEEYSVKIAKALSQGYLEFALTLYHEVPDLNRSIVYGPIEYDVSDDATTLEEYLEDYLES